MFALAVKVTLPPGQKLVDPLAEINAVGRGFTITVTAEEVAEHPELSVTLTE